MPIGASLKAYRPYHLTSLEVPLTCARVVLYGKADMVPLAKPVAEVAAVAIITARKPPNRIPNPSNPTMRRRFNPEPTLYGREPRD